MIKFSYTGALLISLLLAGSGSTAEQAAMAQARNRHVNARLDLPMRSAPTASATAISNPRPAPATDVWLTIILGGGLIALQLRRTQQSVRKARFAV